MPFRKGPGVRAVRGAVAAFVALGAMAALNGCGHDHAGAAAPRTSADISVTAPRSSPPGDDATPSQRPSVTPSTGIPTTATGLPPVISNVPTKDKVVFITIDDGWEKDEDFVSLIGRKHIPITVFLMNDAIKNNYGYYRELQAAGALIGDHTMNHPYMPGLSYSSQKAQICQAADVLGQQYGSRPTLFRAPYGATNHNTLQAAKDCGMRAVFFWREVVTGGRIAYQSGNRLRPGDILLVHFKPDMAADFRRLLDRIQDQGFQPAAIKDYLPESYFA